MRLQRRGGGWGIDLSDIDTIAEQPAREAVRPPARSKQMLRLSLYAELLTVDLIALFLGFLVAERFRGHPWLGPEGFRVLPIIMFLYGLIAFNRSGYSLIALRDRDESIRRALVALIAAMLALLITAYFAQIEDKFPRGLILIATVASTLFLAGGRLIFHGYARARSGSGLTAELLIVDGVAMPAGSFPDVIDAAAEGIHPDLKNPKMLGRLATLLRHYDRVVVAAAPERRRAWSVLLKGTSLAGELLNLEGNELGVIGIGHFRGHETLEVSRGPLSVVNRAKKRALDLAVTVPFLIALAPLMIAVAVLVKLETRGPVFFKQPRVGRGNAMFEILKFRSMRVETSDAAGNRSTTRDDDRITRVGRFIRRTSIDELPQLINVLRGDMSLVGPRPHALGSLAGNKLFWEVNERYWVRHALKPGITGLAQIRGFRGATHHQQDLQNRLQADLEYLAGWSLWGDVMILARTVGVLVHPNAY